MSGEQLDLQSNEKVNRFNQIIKFAKSIIEVTEENQKRENSVPLTHPLIDVIRLIGRDLQTKYLTQLLFKNAQSSLPSFLPETILFSRSNFRLATGGKTFDNFKTPVTMTKEIHLGRDLVLPWPQHRTRLINCISTIGTGRLHGSWKQDFSNHVVELWLPQGIVWVKRGNHSIATGMIQCSGILIPDYIYDISRIYDCVYCDGKNFISKQNDTIDIIIAPVENVEFAAIFEIGRLMRDKSISF